MMGMKLSHMASLSLVSSPRTREISSASGHPVMSNSARLISRERAQRATHRDRILGDRLCYVDDRLGAQLVPSGSELTSEERDEVFYCRAALLQVGDRSEDEGRGVAPGLGEKLLGRKFRVGGVGHGASVCRACDDRFSRTLYAWAHGRASDRTPIIQREPCAL